MDSKTERVYNMSFSQVYPLYINKIERKGRTVEELREVICWLTGYSEEGLAAAIANEISFEEFFKTAPAINPNANKITGVICGIRVEEIEDPIIQYVRYMDKIVDELAKGRKMEKILRA